MSDRDKRRRANRDNKPGKLAEQVAAEIEKDIVAMGWPVGEVIGSESALVERYQVSRAAFREAIRLVEHHMVARMRPGPSGGLVVTQPDPEIVARAMSLYLAYAQVRPSQLIEMRTSIEAQAAELAAARATDEERVELRQFLATELERVRESRLEGKEFHLRVARMAHNPVLYLVIRCLVDLTEEQTIPAGEDRTKVAEQIHAAHAKIGESIIGGDSALARYRMSTHVAAIAPWLSEKVSAGQKSKAPDEETTENAPTDSGHSRSTA